MLFRSALVREAVDHGGRDNITVIVVDVVSGLDGSGVTVNETRSRSGANVTTTEERSVRPSASGPPTKPKAPRRPWIVNLRVVLFFACLAAIVGVVVWTIQNDPGADTEPTATTVAETTLVQLTLETTTVPDETVGDASASSTAPGTGADTATPTESDTVSDPVPGAVVDPFPTTTTTTATTTTRKPR